MLVTTMSACFCYISADGVLFNISKIDPIHTVLIFVFSKAHVVLFLVRSSRYVFQMKITLNSSKTVSIQYL